MMYEAMNDAGHSKTPLILILNDNAMSISKNVGAVSKHLRSLRMSPFYFRSKHAVENFLKKMPTIGKPTANILKQIKRFFRRLVIPTTIFDDMGFIYMGPVDGHNLTEMTAGNALGGGIDGSLCGSAYCVAGIGIARAIALHKNSTAYHLLTKLRVKRKKAVKHTVQDLAIRLSD